MSEPRLFISQTRYFFCGRTSFPFMTLVSFTLALTILAGLRFCLLSLRTRILILLANGITEALLQLFLSCLETVYAKALCVIQERQATGLGTTQTRV